ncbi:MAG: DHH family phosphoesterase [Clostridia bacterium]|nr:DHH family phosphoesterase [Clostridia bacterium]
MHNYELISSLTDAKNICIIGHLNADTDALCSMYCLREFLISRLQNVNIVLATDTDSLQSNYLAILENTPINALIDDIDTAISIDCPNIGRLGKFSNIFTQAKTKIVIDHHQTNNYFGDINIVENNSSSCEIIYNIMKFYNYEISNEILGRLYAGIITDTMNFTVGELTDTTFEIASLASKRVDTQSIYDNFLNHHSATNMKLLAEAINNIKSFNDGKIIISYIRPKLVKKLKASFDEYTGIINRLSSIQNNFMTCLIEPKDNIFYVSLRGKRSYNVGEIAKKYGGGGHAGAAAFDSNLSLKKIKKLILNEFTKILKSTNKNYKFKF